MDTIQLTVPDKNGEPFTQTYIGPTTWSEASEKQYWALCKVLMLINRHDFLRLTLPSVLYGIPFEKLQWLMDATALMKSGLTDEQIADALDYGQQLIQKADWVFNTLPQYKWPLPSLTIDRKNTVYGPGDGLRHLTFEEFMFAERCWSKYRDGQDEAQLLKLCAILLRPKSSQLVPVEGDQRLPFQPLWVERDTKRFGKLSHVERWGILFAYEGARAELVAHFKNVFQKPADDQKASHSGGWYDVALSLAGPDVAKFEANNRANVYLVLAMLDKAIADQEALKNP
jgi:hypothetical protein